MKAASRGSAFVVVLVLLSGLAALALGAAAAAMTALALAGHQQMAQNAFEAAETGIAVALATAAETRDGGDDDKSLETAYPGHNVVMCEAGCGGARRIVHLAQRAPSGERTIARAAVLIASGPRFAIKKIDVPVHQIVIDGHCNVRCIPRPNRHVGIVPH